MQASRFSAETMVLGAVCLSCTANRHGDSGKAVVVTDETPGLTPEESDSLWAAVRKAMTEARQAVNEHGVTEVAMGRICEGLGSLAREPGLKNEYSMRKLHGGGATSVVLASESDEGLTLRLSKFEPGKPTPIHDHGSWAVAYVVEGRDDYIHWQRSDDGSDPDHAKLQIQYKRILHPGDCVHWLDPPHDIHSQQAIGEPTWELVLFGKNHGRTPRQYFDPETGNITRRLPQ